MDHVSFKSLCQAVKEGDEAAVNEMLNMFEPLLRKHSIIDGVFDEDCFQELRIKLLECITKFNLKRDYDIKRPVENKKIK